MFKVDNKNTGTSYGTCLKLKLKNKYTGATLSNGVLLSLLLHFLPGCSAFIVDFEHLNDGWECCVCILITAIQVTISSSKSRVCFYSSLPEYCENSYKSISGMSKKKVSLKFSSGK